MRTMTCPACGGADWTAAGMFHLSTGLARPPRRRWTGLIKLLATAGLALGVLAVLSLIQYQASLGFWQLLLAVAFCGAAGAVEDRSRRDWTTARRAYAASKVCQRCGELFSA
jgi:peptidoglycan/LPS O-acetylase OafA/YrhL